MERYCNCKVCCVTFALSVRMQNKGKWKKKVSPETGDCQGKR